MQKYLVMCHGKFELLVIAKSETDAKRRLKAGTMPVNQIGVNLESLKVSRVDEVTQLYADPEIAHLAKMGLKI